MTPQQSGRSGWVGKFLSGVPYAVKSSYCVAARYDAEASVLYIGYGDGAIWAYGNISPMEAESFARAPSKGKWMWDNVRVRGDKNMHQKPARRVA